MAYTFKLISSYTAPSNVEQVVFSSIPSTYDDLCILCNGKDTGNTWVYFVKINDNESNGRLRRIEATNSSIGTDYVNTLMIVDGPIGSAATSNQFGNSRLYFYNYAKTDRVKVWAGDATSLNDSSTSYYGSMANGWNSTSAISSITLYIASENNRIATNSRFTLYGIKNT